MRKQTKQNISRIGIRELKNKASQILKRVREKNETWTVTLDGTDIATITPTGEHLTQDEITANRKKVLLTIDELADQISAKWDTSTKESSVDAVRKIRR